MKVEVGRPRLAAAPATPFRGSVVVGPGSPAVMSDYRRMLYYSMKHRTQLYLDEGQYRWLRQRAGKSGSIAAVVRELIEAERAKVADPAGDPLLRFLVDEPAARGGEGTSVTTLDLDVYGR